MKYKRVLSFLLFFISQFAASQVSLQDYLNGKRDFTEGDIQNALKVIKDKNVPFMELIQLQSLVKDLERKYQNGELSKFEYENKLNSLKKELQDSPIQKWFDEQKKNTPKWIDNNQKAYKYEDCSMALEAFQRDAIEDNQDVLLEMVQCFSGDDYFSGDAMYIDGMLYPMD